jgi:iron complex transport system ATP-binding protein
MLALNYCHKLLLLSEGKLIGQVLPRSHSLQEMEALLARIYGPVSLQLCKNRSGKDMIVMLKEDTL